MPRIYKNLTRLFIDCPLFGGELVRLDKNQANYLLNVLRKKQNDELIIFNGKDGAWLAKITNDNKKKCEIKPIKQIIKQTKPSDIYYFFAPLKRARLDYMVQKATEMGVEILQPIITQYTQINRLKYDRLKANIIEAAEQCEVLNIPKLLEQTSLENLIKNWKENYGQRKLILADETKEAISPIATLSSLRGEKIALLIGPEGGFSQQELEFLHEQDFIVPISLGQQILRADTAAIAALALIQGVMLQ